MFAAGRLQVNDPPPGTTAAHNLENTKYPLLLSYEELMKMLAKSCDGFSGAAIAGVTRAAASRGKFSGLHCYCFLKMFKIDSFNL